MNNNSVTAFEQILDQSISWLDKRPTILFSLFCFFFVPVIYFFCQADPDLFARMAVGRLIFQTGAIPFHDVFAFTKTKALWVDHEWLSGVIFYLVNQIGGDAALFLFATFTAFCTLYLLFALIIQKVKPTLALLWLVICTLPSSLIWTSVVRAHVFTYLFFAILLWIFVKLRQGQGSNWIFSLPVLFALWANLHGGFVVGLGFLSLVTLLAFFDQKLPFNRLALVTGLSYGAILINPYGFEFVKFMFAALSLKRELVTEWAPLDLWSGSSVLIWFVALVVFIRPKRLFELPLEAIIFLVLTLVFGIRHQRFIPFFLLTAVVHAPKIFEQFVLELPQILRARVLTLKRALNFLFLAISFIGALTTLYFLSTIKSFQPDYHKLPVESVNWLKNSTLSGKLLTHFNDGSFALWHLYPRFKVALDGRYEEVYSEETFHEVLSAFDVTAPNHQDVMARINPDFILLCKESAPGVDHQAFGKGWQVIHADGSCMVLARIRNDGSR